MSLKCGIIGIANVGKTTLFNCLSSTHAESSRYAFTSSKSNVGLINVPDKRLYQLASLVKQEKITPATVEIVDIPGLTKGSSHGEGVGNKFLSDIRNTDALIHVLRCFDDETLPHIDGTVDPVRDMETIELELLIKDMESVEKKIEKVEKVVKAGEKKLKHDLDILLRYKEHLESFQPALTLPPDVQDRSVVEDLFLLTAKPVLYVCNVDEASVIQGNNYVNRVKEALRGKNEEVLIMGARLEAEIAELEDPADRKAFLEDAGLPESGADRLVRSAYRILNLISFFTCGPKEVRAWTIQEGYNVQQAAGAIHSDMERGFIRAEVIKFDDYYKLGSEHECKEAGKISIEGKNYIVEDGDVIYIRFNI
jgi:GTP-binding protein YchF